MCGDGFESARAYGEGAAGGDAAFYPAKGEVESFLFFWGGSDAKQTTLAEQTEGLRAGGLDAKQTTSAEAGTFRSLSRANL